MLFVNNLMGQLLFSFFLKKKMSVHEIGSPFNQEHENFYLIPNLINSLIYLEKV